MAKKINNFKEMKKDELKKELILLQENLRVLHFKAEGSKSKNVKEASALKKQIARILTEINK
ncbi:50S ribosomal protein L29 [Patescibacteria group bacterium]|nr:50S ribosomal protein L29 [Patescibacteria group bacterium]